MVACIGPGAAWLLLAFIFVLMFVGVWLGCIAVLTVSQGCASSGPVDIGGGDAISVAIVGCEGRYRFLLAVQCGRVTAVCWSRKHIL